MRETVLNLRGYTYAFFQQIVCVLKRSGMALGPEDAQP